MEKSFYNFIYNFIYDGFYGSYSDEDIADEILIPNEFYYETWKVYNERYSNYAVVLNIKGRGFPNIEDVEKKRREYDNIVIDSFIEKWENGDFETWFWDDVSSETEFIGDDLGVPLYAFGRSGGYWGFTVKDLLNNLTLFEIDKSEIESLTENIIEKMKEDDVYDEFQKNYSESYLREIEDYIDDNIDWGDKKHYVFVMSKEFEEFLDKAKKEIEAIINYFETNYIFDLLDSYYINNEDSF